MTLRETHQFGNPVKVAVFFDQEINSGGGYQQALNAALLAKKIPTNIGEVVFVTDSKKELVQLKKYGVEALFINLNKISRLKLALFRLIKKSFPTLTRYTLSSFQLDFFFTKRKIDLIYFLSPNKLAYNLEKTNYITTVWDLCHRDHPEFPEIRKFHEFERREKILNKILHKATAIIVDSKKGAENLNYRYKTDPERVFVIPFSPAQSVSNFQESKNTKIFSIADKYNLSVPYIFYPAQFWPHKNHIYILYGLKILEEKYGHKIAAIFTGGDKGNLEYLRLTAQKIGIEERIFFTGFVPNEEIPELYRQALALVMPTYFGPTNLPPLEAFRLGVPVLYSDLPGLKEQVSGAALLLDLTNPENLAQQLDRLIADPKLRELLVENGIKYFKNNTPEKSLETLTEIIMNFGYKRNCWF